MHVPPDGLLERFQQNERIDRPIPEEPQGAERVRELRFALDQLAGVEPLRVVVGLCPKEVRIVDRDRQLEYALPIERDLHSSPLGQHVEPGRPEFSGRPHQAACVRVGEPMSGVENSASGGRGFPGTDVGEEYHVETGVGEREGGREAGNAATDDGDISAGVCHGVLGREGMAQIIAGLKLMGTTRRRFRRTSRRGMKC